NDARRIGPESKHHQIEHQLQMLAEVARNAGWGGRRAGLSLRFPIARIWGGGEVDTPFDRMHRFEVFIEFELIVAAEFLAQIFGIFECEIQQMAIVSALNRR